MSRTAPLRRIMIVGGGLAAARAAERLVERGYEGRLDIVGAEPHDPYRRPALSEGVLTGHLNARDVRINAPAPRLTRWLHSRRVVGLDRQEREVELDDGRRLPYDGLVIATGVGARTLDSVAALDPALVHQIRTLDDARRLRAAARRMRRLLVIGGGLIGSEAAASMASNGVRVTVVEPAPQLLGQVVGETLGASLATLHRRRGVDVRVATTVSAFAQEGRTVRATLTDGTIVEADAVLVAVGSQPHVEWLAGSGLDLSDGVLCDPWLFAVGSADDDIVAAGDVARWRNARFEGRSSRVEQWVTTTLMARHAVDSLLDGRGAAAPFAPVPWGWTEQWGVRIHMVGSIRGAVEHRLFEGDPAGLRGAYSLHDATGRLVGGVSADRPGATLELTAKIAAEWPGPVVGTDVWEQTTASDVAAAGRDLSAAEDSADTLDDAQPDRRAFPRQGPATRPGGPIR